MAHELRHAIHDMDKKDGSGKSGFENQFEVECSVHALIKYCINSTSVVAVADPIHHIDYYDMLSRACDLYFTIHFISDMTLFIHLCIHC